MTDTPKEREADGPWAKLHHRKLVQWALAYVAGAWALLQVLGFAADAFAWPAVVKQLAMLALVIGLPIALTVAWYQGEQGQQRVSGPELAVLTLLLLVGGGLLWLHAQRNASNAAAANNAVKNVGVIDGRPSIAVLPFENRSRAEDDVFFVDGIHDDILTQLSKVSALKVISRTSVERFRDTRESTRAIAEQLGVTSILEGGVQRSGSRLRINVQLIDATNDAHLWAETYDRELTATDLFAIQSEVAAAIAGALKTTLTPAERSRAGAVPTKSLEAWKAYQLGRQRMAKRTTQGLTEAEKHFRKAISIDPAFALAYVGLADALHLQVSYAGVPRQVSLTEKEAAIENALRLDPGLGEAWASAGLAAYDQNQYARAERNLLRAIELSPNYATAHHWLSLLYREVGRVDEAVVAGQRSVELDPYYSMAHENLGNALAGVGTFREAEISYRKAMQIDPDRPGPHNWLGVLLAYAQNRFAEALPLVQKAAELDDGNPVFVTQLIYLRLDLQDASNASRLLVDGLERWPNHPGINDAAAMERVLAGDFVAARSYALKTLEVEQRYPGALAIAGADDERRGEFRAARARYVSGFPELFDGDGPTIDGTNFWRVIDAVRVLRRTGESSRATQMLDRIEQVMRPLPRLGSFGFWITDVQVHALRGDKAKALAALRDAVKSGWRGPAWRYYRDVDPNLALIRNDPEFKSAFAEIERDMARQRAELAKRPATTEVVLTKAGL